jgi:beta-xylosidase
MIESRIGAGHGSAWETWKDLGSPQTLSREEMRLLRSHSQPECVLHSVEKEGWGFSLSPGEVALLELRPRGAAALPKSGLRRELLEWERRMGETSR